MCTFLLFYCLFVYFFYMFVSLSYETYIVYNKLLAFSMFFLLYDFYWLILPG